MNEIRSFRGRYFFLSNFFQCKIVLPYSGEEFPSLENAFQAMKTTNQDSRKLLCCADAGIAKKLGRTFILPKGWLRNRKKLMTSLLFLKFTQNPQLIDKLLETGDASLVEGNDWGDEFWGVNNKTGVGSNNLGRILMHIRTLLFAKRNGKNIERYEDILLARLHPLYDNLLLLGIARLFFSICDKGHCIRVEGLRHLDPRLNTILENTGAEQMYKDYKNAYKLPEAGTCFNELVELALLKRLSNGWRCKALDIVARYFKNPKELYNPIIQDSLVVNEQEI